MQPLKATRAKHNRIFEFIKFNISVNDEAPTLKEIGREFGMTSSGSVHNVLKHLETAGLIRRTPNISRGIEVCERETRELMIGGREG